MSKAKQLYKKGKLVIENEDAVYQKLSKENTIKIIEFDIPRTYPSLGMIKSFGFKRVSN